MHSGVLEGLDLLLGASLSSGDDGSGVTHTTARGRRETSNERHNGFGTSARVVLLEELGSILFVVASNLTDEDDSLGLGVANEDIEAIDKVGAVEGISSDSDAERLAEADVGGLVDGLVGQSSGSRHDSDLSLLVNVAGHDTNLAFLRLDNSGAVGADQSGLALRKKPVLDANHVVLGNSLGNADSQGDLSIQGLFDGLCGERRRHEDHGGGGTSLVHSLLDAVEDGLVEVSLTALSGSDSTNEVGAILDGLAGVEGSLLAGEALADDLRVLTDFQGVPCGCVLPEASRHLSRPLNKLGGEHGDYVN